MSANLSICCLALAVEALIGYPGFLFQTLGHPVTWMGSLIARLDRRWNRDGDPPPQRQRNGFGATAVLLAISGVTSLGATAAAYGTLPKGVALVVLGLLASSCLAQRSLDTHVRAVADALETDDIVAARRAVAAIVGRETAELETTGVARAAIESLAENFADGVVAPAFWVAIFGLPGGIIYKAINTADSMIAHRTPRHESFGFCAAKLDDAVSWPGARIAALWLILAASLAPGASMRAGWRVMRRDARGHPSPNAGWPEAAMAGALNLRLGGPRIYAGQTVEDAVIGDGDRIADAAAIRAALRLYRVACGLQLGVVGALALLIAQWR